LNPFYFHVFAGGEFYPDREGVACSSLVGARLHAVRLIGLVVRLAPCVYPWRAWSVIVAADDGSPVLAVPFAGNLPAPAETPAALAPRRFPQIITYGDPGSFGPAANEPGIAAPGRPRAPIRPARGLDATQPTRRSAMDRTLSRRVARLLGLEWRLWGRGKPRRFPLRPASHEQDGGFRPGPFGPMSG
jgi:hypothetical protein